jgi:hypothetical protein
MCHRHAIPATPKRQLDLDRLTQRVRPLFGALPAIAASGDAVAPPLGKGLDPRLLEGAHPHRAQPGTHDVFELELDHRHRQAL